MNLIKPWCDGHCSILLTRVLYSIHSCGISGHDVNGNIGDFQSLVVGSNPAARIPQGARNTASGVVT